VSDIQPGQEGQAGQPGQEGQPGTVASGGAGGHGGRGGIGGTGGRGIDQNERIIRLLNSVRHLCILLVGMLVVGTLVLVGTWNALLVNRTHIDDNTAKVQAVVDNIVVFNANHERTQRLVCDLQRQLKQPPSADCR
jgi:hypothetical protein